MVDSNNDSPSRDGEPASSHHFRGDRLVVVNGDWFIVTREGIDVGPYASREDAAAAADRLAGMLVGITDPAITTEFIREFMLLPRT